MHPLLARLIISFVLFLILFPVVTSQVFIIWPWYGHEWSVELITLLVPFNVLALMLLWNYYLCIFVDPGSVPDGWEPDVLAGEGYEVKKLTGGPRYCRTCERYKPPRSHHCRQCNRCVLRMDHHCPWVNNCIGHFNYGHFIRFLFYVDTTCAYHLFMVTCRVMATMRKYLDEPSGFEFFCIILNYALVVPVILAVGAFSLYHFYNLTSNTTTIEGWEKDKAATLRRNGKVEEVKFPYDLGIWRNMASILGSNPLLWCCPLASPGTGLKFQLTVANGEWYELSASDGTIRSQYLQISSPLSVPPMPFYSVMRSVKELIPILSQTGYDVEGWPPRDPALRSQKPFKLPDNPWTYENGDVNPALRPSNTRQRPNGQHSSARAYTSALPPYHPEFEHDVYPHQTYSTESDTDAEDEYQGLKLRRGSEGYEVRPINREEMLTEYIRHEAERTGRYQVYQPENAVPPEDYESDSRDEAIVSDDDRPLGLRV